MVMVLRKETSKYVPRVAQRTSVVASDMASLLGRSAE
jgi:hypothetical protein